jgi:hypothetical protein
MKAVIAGVFVPRLKRKSILKTSEPVVSLTSTLYTILVGYTVILGQTISLGGTAVLLFVVGLDYWVTHLRALASLAKNHERDMMLVGVSARKMLYAQLVGTAGISLSLFSFVFAPSLFPGIFLVVFLIPMPLYLSAQRSIWNYYGLWSYKDFGDEAVRTMRAHLKRRRTAFLKLLLVTNVFGVSLILVAIILPHVLQVVQRR